MKRLLFFSAMFFGLAVILLSSKSPGIKWETHISIKGGKENRGCAASYQSVQHKIDYQNQKETLSCKGRGVNPCPFPVNKNDSIMKVRIESKVRSGSSQGTIVNKDILAVALYQNGSVNRKSLIAYNATIYTFYNRAALNNYLNTTK